MAQTGRSSSGSARDTAPDGGASIGSPDNGRVSYWYSELGLPAPTNPLRDNAEADVVIVGAGYTGLWTAYYLAKARPRLSIRIIEQHFVGYGASGRNGGWLTNSITGGQDGYAAEFGRDAVARFQNHLNATVDEVIRVAEREGIDAEIHKGGSLLVARNAAQLGRAAGLAAHAERWPEEGLIRLSVEETNQHIRVSNTVAGFWQPHCARIHPAKLAVGLGTVVRALGVDIHEGTRVEEISAGEVVIEGGARVRAGHVIRATEGFTAALKGHHREWVPLNSSMIITEPLDDAAWDEIGWQNFDTLEDLAHVYSYSQRTPDGRIALGGRGNPYRFGSATDTDGRLDQATIAALTGILRDWFPAAATAPVAHAWTGVLGVPRNWRATVGYSAETGLGWAGGYVGTGVAATNLAGRTLCDLILGEESELTTLPWVNQRSRNWEIEPLRWLAVQGIYAAYGAADRAELDGRTATSRIARIANLISGR